MRKEGAGMVKLSGTILNLILQAEQQTIQES
jgi:hypothetical protein